jgi:hypothetical protein
MEENYISAEPHTQMCGRRGAEDAEGEKKESFFLRPLSLCFFDWFVRWGNMKRWVTYSLVPILALAVFWVHHLDNQIQALKAAAPEVLYVQPDQLSWSSGTALLFGHPNKSGLYTIRIKLPENTTIQPTSQRQNQFITVLSGSLNLGIGETFNKEAATLLPAEGAVQIPSNTSYYAWTTEETIVEIHSIGPRKSK